MSISSEITRLQTAKSDLKTAIEAKGVTVPSSATIDTYDDYVSQISGGGCQAEEDLKGMIERSATAITIPSGATTIGEYAFYYYSGLTSVNIPDSVTSIGKLAFNRCTSLTGITIPSGVTAIGDRAFEGCSVLTSCTIGNGVTSIGQNAFRSCNGLISVTINATEPPTLGTNVFSGTPLASGTGTIYVPSGSVDTYKAANRWSDYASRIQAIPNS